MNGSCNEVWYCDRILERLHRRTKLGPFWKPVSFVSDIERYFLLQVRQRRQMKSDLKYYLFYARPVTSLLVTTLIWPFVYWYWNTGTSQVDHIWTTCLCFHDSLWYRDPMANPFLLVSSNSYPTLDSHYFVVLKVPPFVIRDFVIVLRTWKGCHKFCYHSIN